ncbi:EpsG family protein [Pectobacterium polaris]|uniref:EpsG family protein n=1 Tax=Pectobacterium polaris TaxID=2042057 RepID=UPI0020BEFBF4|nr:EpsG family protein [Pectobacterium polaris]
MVIFIISFSFFILAYSPILSAGILIVSSLILYNNRNFILTTIYFFILSVSLASIYSYQTKDDATDFLIYYQYYHTVFNSFSFSDSSFEPGYYVLNKVISEFGLISEIGFSIVMNTIIFMANYFSLYFFISKKYPEIRNFFLVLMLSFVLMKLGSLALLWRQSLALPFLISILAVNNKPGKVILFLLAISFHYSSIIIAPLVYYIDSLTLSKRKLITFILPVGFLWSVGLGSSIHSILPGFISNKLAFSLIEPRLEYFMDAVKTIIFFIPVFILISLDFLLNKGFVKARGLTKESSIIIFVFLFIMSFSLVPHSFRFIYPLSVSLISIYSVVFLNRIKNMALYYFIFCVLIILSFSRFILLDTVVGYELFYSSPFGFLI